MIIRTAMPDDFPQIADMIDAYTASSPVPYPAPDKRKLMYLVAISPDSQHMRGYVAEENSKITGMIFGTAQDHLWADGRWAWICLLLVDPARRGSMAAPRLVKAFDDWARSVGASQIVFDHSSGVDTERGVQFMQHMGYAPIGVMMRKLV